MLYSFVLYITETGDGAIIFTWPAEYYSLFFSQALLSSLFTCISLLISSNKMVLNIKAEDLFFFYLQL